MLIKVKFNLMQTSTNNWAVIEDKKLDNILNSIRLKQSNEIFNEVKNIYNYLNRRGVKIQNNKKEFEAIFNYVKPSSRDGIFDEAIVDVQNPLSFLDAYAESILGSSDEEARIESLKYFTEELKKELNVHLPKEVNKFKKLTFTTSDITLVTELTQEQKEILQNVGYVLDDNMAINTKTGEAYIVPFVFGNILDANLTDVAGDVYHWYPSPEILDPWLIRLIDSKNISTNIKNKITSLAPHFKLLPQEWSSFLSDENLPKIIEILEDFDPSNMQTSNISTNKLPVVLNELKLLFNFEAVIMPLGGCKIGDDKTVHHFAQTILRKGRNSYANAKLNYSDHNHNIIPNASETILDGIKTNRLGFSKIYSKSYIETSINNGRLVTSGDNDFSFYTPISKIVKAYTSAGQTSMQELAADLANFNKEQMEIYQCLPQELKNKLNKKRPKLPIKKLIVIKNEETPPKIVKIGFEFAPQDFENALTIIKNLLPEREILVNRSESSFLLNPNKKLEEDFIKQEGWHVNREGEICLNLRSYSYMKHFTNTFFDNVIDYYGTHDLNGNFTINNYGIFGKDIKDNKFVEVLKESDIVFDDDKFIDLRPIDLLLEEVKKMHLEVGKKGILFENQKFNGYQIIVYRNRENIEGSYSFVLTNPEINKIFSITFHKGGTPPNPYIKIERLNKRVFGIGGYISKEICRLLSNEKGKVLVRKEDKFNAEMEAERRELKKTLNEIFIYKKPPEPTTNFNPTQTNEIKLMFNKVCELNLTNAERRVMYQHPNGFKIVGCKYYNKDDHYIQLWHPTKGAFEINKIAFEDNGRQVDLNKNCYTIHKANIFYNCLHIICYNNYKTQTFRLGTDYTGKFFLTRVPSDEPNEVDTKALEDALCGFIENLKTSEASKDINSTGTQQTTCASTINLDNFTASITENGSNRLFMQSGEPAQVESLNEEQRVRLGIEMSTTNTRRRSLER